MYRSLYNKINTCVKKINKTMIYSETILWCKLFDCTHMYSKHNNILYYSESVQNFRLKMILYAHGILHRYNELSKISFLVYIRASGMLLRNKRFGRIYSLVLIYEKVNNFDFQTHLGDTLGKYNFP